MRKILLLVLICISSIAYSQWGRWNLHNIYSSPFNTTFVGLAPPFQGVIYNERAKEFFARVTALGKTLTDAQKSWYNDSIFVPLLDSGLIGTTRAGDSLAVLYAFPKFANNDTTICNMNLLADQYNAIHYGTVTYTDSGVAGDNSTGYLTTQFDASLDSSIYRFNSASLGFYSKTQSTDNDNDLTNGSYIYIGSNTFGIFGATVNSDFINYGSNTVSKGCIMWSRQLRTLSTAYKNGIALYTSATVTTGVRFPKIRTGLTSRCYTFIFIGSGLSATKSRALSNILNNSLKGRNYNVY